MHLKSFKHQDGLIRGHQPLHSARHTLEPRSNAPVSPGSTTLPNSLFPISPQQPMQKFTSSHKPSLTISSAYSADLERLHLLKETILNGQHPDYKPIPQPDALTALYLGPKVDSQIKMESVSEINSEKLVTSVQRDRNTQSSVRIDTAGSSGSDLGSQELSTIRRLTPLVEYSEAANDSSSANGAARLSIGSSGRFSGSQSFSSPGAARRPSTTPVAAAVVHNGLRSNGQRHMHVLRAYENSTDRGPRSGPFHRRESFPPRGPSHSDARDTIKEYEQTGMKPSNRKEDTELNGVDKGGVHRNGIHPSITSLRRISEAENLVAPQPYPKLLHNTAANRNDSIEYLRQVPITHSESPKTPRTSSDERRLPTNDDLVNTSRMSGIDSFGMQKRTEFSASFNSVNTSNAESPLAENQRINANSGGEFIGHTPASTEAATITGRDLETSILNQTDVLQNSSASPSLGDLTKSMSVASSDLAANDKKADDTTQGTYTAPSPVDTGDGVSIGGAHPSPYERDQTRINVVARTTDRAETLSKMGSHQSRVSERSRSQLDNRVISGPNRQWRETRNSYPTRLPKSLNEPGPPRYMQEEPREWIQREDGFRGYRPTALQDDDWHGEAAPRTWSPELGMDIIRLADWDSREDNVERTHRGQIRTWEQSSYRSRLVDRLSDSYSLGSDIEPSELARYDRYSRSEREGRLARHRSQSPMSRSLLLPTRPVEDAMRPSKRVREDLDDTAYYADRGRRSLPVPYDYPPRPGSPGYYGIGSSRPQNPTHSAYSTRQVVYERNAAPYPSFRARDGIYPSRS